MDFSLQFRPLELKGLTCARCGETIVAETGYFTSRFVSKHPKVLGRTCEFHPACALAMDLFGFLQAVHEDKTPFTGRGSLEEVLENRTALIRARAAERPTTQKDPLYSRCFLVEPALSIHGGVEQNVPFVRDASGRPTVRILYTGSLFLQPGTRSAQVHRLLANGSYCSAKREYQFVGPTEDFVNATGDCDLPREDPSVPIVGTLSGVSVNHQTPVRGLRHLSLWNAHGLPPPLLWIIGLQRNKPRDGETQKARDALEQAGFSPDESPVVYSRAVDSSALDTLVTALDEYFASGAELRQTQDTLYATATRLHQHLKDERWDRVDACFCDFAEGGRFSRYLAYAYARRTEVVLVDCIERMLANDRALMACELLDRLAVRDETVLRRVFDACLVTVVDMSRDGNEFARRLHMAAHALWRITRQFPLESLWMALMDTNDPTRAKRLGHVICSCNELAVRTEVRERLHSLEAQNDSRQMLAQELLNHMNAQDLIELVRRKP